MHASGLRKGPIALLSQEHHACKDRLADLQSQVRKEGWRLTAAEAVRTEGKGRSAGVGVGTPLHIGAGRRDSENWDWSTRESPGRGVRHGVRE